MTGRGMKGRGAGPGGVSGPINLNRARKARARAAERGRADANAALHGLTPAERRAAAAEAARHRRRVDAHRRADDEGDD